jgi:hypothetical protein
MKNTIQLHEFVMRVNEIFRLEIQRASKIRTILIRNGLNPDGRARQRLSPREATVLVWCFAKKLNPAVHESEFLGNIDDDCIAELTKHLFDDFSTPQCLWISKDRNFAMIDMVHIPAKNITYFIGDVKPMSCENFIRVDDEALMKVRKVFGSQRD